MLEEAIGNYHSIIMQRPLYYFLNHIGQLMLLLPKDVHGTISKTTPVGEFSSDANLG